MNRDFTSRLAELFGTQYLLVLSEQELVDWGVDKRGSAREVWERVVHAAVRHDRVIWLLHRAEQALRRLDDMLRRAAFDLAGDDPRVEQWMCELDRTRIRETVADDAIIASAPAVVALALTGPRGAGHEFMAHWARYEFEQRRKAVEITWPRDETGSPNRTHLACARLAKTLEFEEVAPGDADDVTRDTTYWDALAERVAARVSSHASRDEKRRAVVLFRHVLMKPQADDVDAVGWYLSCLWTRVASRLSAHGVPSRQCVISVEVMTANHELSASIAARAVQSASPQAGFVAPRLDPLGAVTKKDLHFWLRGPYQHTLVERLCARRREFVKLRGDLSALAAAIVANHGDEYEDIIKLFRE